MKLQISQVVSVIANKKFNTWELKLFAISNSISIVKDDKTALLGHKTVLYAGQGFRVLMSQGNDSLQQESKSYTTCILLHFGRR